jgi:hypothetical protein
MILKKRLGVIARRVLTCEMPDWLVRLLANFIPDLRLIALELGNVGNLTNAKAKRISTGHHAPTKTALWRRPRASRASVFRKPNSRAAQRHLVIVTANVDWLDVYL